MSLELLGAAEETPPARQVPSTSASAAATPPTASVAVVSWLPKMSPRAQALHGLLGLGGAVAGAYFWPAHRIIGFFLGGALGGGVAALVAGE